MERTRSKFKQRSLIELIVLLCSLTPCAAAATVSHSDTTSANISACIWRDVVPCMRLVPDTVRRRIEELLRNDWLPVDNDVGQARHWAFACYLRARSLPYESTCISCSTPHRGCTAAAREERQSDIWNEVCDLYCGPVPAPAGATSSTYSLLALIIAYSIWPQTLSHSFTPFARSISKHITVQTSSRPRNAHGYRGSSLPVAYSDGKSDGGYRATYSVFPVGVQIGVLVAGLLTLLALIYFLFVWCSRASQHGRDFGTMSGGNSSATSSVHASAFTIESSRPLIVPNRRTRTGPH